MSDSHGLLAKSDRALTPVENFANLLAALAIFALMCLGVAQIAMRSIFNAPITGYIDLVELSMASMAFDTRLINTCSSRLCSAIISGRSGSRSRCTSIS